MVLEDLEQAVRVVGVVTHQPFDELARNQRAFAGLGVHAHKPVLGFDQAGTEDFAVRC